MYISNPLLALMLARLAALSLASPAPASPISIRSPVCANLPDTVAGTVPHHRNPKPAIPAGPAPNPHIPGANKGIVWCLEATSIYIILDITPLPVNNPLIPFVQGALENATTGLLHHIETGQDGPVADWVFQWPKTENIVTKGVVLAGLSNAKGLTWSALDGAFMAFWDYMQHRGYGLGQFRIYYGLQFVGKGALRENRT